MAGLTERAFAVAETASTEPRPGAEPEASLEPVLEGLARAFGFERALVALSDERRRVLRGRYGRAIAEELAEAYEVPLANADDPTVVAFQTGVPQRVDDVTADERVTEATRGILSELGFSSYVIAPLRATGVVLLSKGTPASDADVQALLP